MFRLSRWSTALVLSFTTAVGVVSTARAQALFRDDAPLTLTLTTNLRDLVRERDSTDLRWFGAEMSYADSAGTLRRLPVELRARGHFRRQARNCAFPPLFIRAERAARDGTILQGNPRLKLVTPCRPTSDDYQQYIYVEYLTYRTYAIVNPVHHRTRLARITYRDSTDRVKPITVMAFFLEIEEEVADEAKLKFTEQTGAVFDDMEPEALNRLSLFEYWVGNTDWSLGALHNISIFQKPDGPYVPIAYDFDWSGVVNARYSFPSEKLGIRTVRDRLHRGPCRSSAEWAPIIAHFQSKRAAVDSLWSAPLAGLEPKRQADSKAFLDQLWPILADAKRVERDLVKTCQKVGN
ncbi:MAG: hypothetical protein IT357_05360 [Gemmatimonadaceae bacterium]|nr:hypothetical protein [Gemmatimonadaceae bacterium]